MTIRMDEGAAELLDTLHRAGYAAYVVGGCGRALVHRSQSCGVRPSRLSRTQPPTT